MKEERKLTVTERECEETNIGPQEACFTHLKSNNKMFVALQHHSNNAVADSLAPTKWALKLQNHKEFKIKPSNDEQSDLENRN